MHASQLRRAALASIILLMTALLTADCFAGQPKKESAADKEAREAAEEDAAEAKASESEQIMARQSFTGKLVLGTDSIPEPPAGVVGLFSSTTGRVMMVKLADSSVSAKLKPHHNTTCTITGKLRNQGKYLIAYDVAIRPPPPVERSKRGGL